MTLLGVCVALPFLAVLCLRVRRIEDKWGVLSLTTIFCGVIVVPGFLFPLMIAATAAFRPEQRSPEVTQTLNDVFWLMFVGIVGTLVVQALVLATANVHRPHRPADLPAVVRLLQYLVCAAGGARVVRW